MDPQNPVVKLCVEGMRAEGAGRYDEARALFWQAWQARQDDYDACIAAHYVARHQTSPQEMLRWNRKALERAAAVADARVQAFYPSLYLNMGWSHEQCGALAAAENYYALAAACLDELPAALHLDVVRRGVAAGRARLTHAAAEQGKEPP